MRRRTVTTEKATEPLKLQSRHGIHDLVRLAGLGPGDRVIEIGCGTGQATVPLAERGLTITAVELGAELAAVAPAAAGRLSFG
jgi:16S rRNA A1518/A1519 N6-dimethyltransferase RsmA/KsgA/DIM1 with predicted DNA glycosylase/AP lyase activity